MLGVSHGFCERIDFSGHQGTGAGNGREFSNARCGGLGAVRGTEGVVHKHITERRILFREFRIVFLFTLVRAAVFKHHHFARLHTNAVKIVFHKADGLPHELTHTHSHAGQAVFGLEFPFGGTPEVAHDEHGGAGVKRKADCRDARHKARFVGNTAFIVSRHIKVTADQNTFAV